MLDEFKAVATIRMEERESPSILVCVGAGIWAWPYGMGRIFDDQRWQEQAFLMEELTEIMTQRPKYQKCLCTLFLPYRIHTVH